MVDNNYCFIKGTDSSLKGEDNKNNTLLVSFCGRVNIGDTLKFEFLNILKNVPQIDKLFFIDAHQYWYHKGIKGISNNVDSTAKYIKNKIQKYNKIIFIGVSMGGYAAILFGSLLNVSTVVAFLPQTTLHKHSKPDFEKKYMNLKPFINNKTSYFLYGPDQDKIKYGLHSIYQCENINHFPNVTLEQSSYLNLKKLRDTGILLPLLLFYINGSEGQFSINDAMFEIKKSRTEGEN